MKILITGASGFIGTNLLSYFIGKGYNVKNFDFNTPLDESAKKFWVNLDITDYDKLIVEIEKFDPEYIVHLAARTDLDGLTLEDYSANTIGVNNILKVAKKLSNLKKIIITSSMLVCKVGYTPKSQKDYNPTTIYGESKVETENEVWNNQPTCDWAIIRPTSIWGAWFREPYRNFFDMLISKKYFHIGNKGCTKTYGYVGNAVYQIESILFNETPDKDNKVFYIGDYQETNIEDWANEISHELGYNVIRMPFFVLKIAACVGDILSILHIKFPMTSFRLRNMTTNNYVDLSNTQQVAPNLPFKRIEGIKTTLEWMVNH